MESTKGERTRNRILGTAKQLFGTKTYDYVTTRMIAQEAHCSQSAIAFYFGTKENLCSAVIDDILKYHKFYYEPLAQSVAECAERKELDADRAFSYLQQYLQMQVEIAFDKRNRCAISFSVNGATLPDGLSDRLNESILLNVTVPMAHLIVTYAGVSVEKALVYSVALTNCIIAYPFTGSGAQKELLRLNQGDPQDSTDVQIVIRQTKQYLIELCLQMLRSLAPGNMESTNQEAERRLPGEIFLHGQVMGGPQPVRQIP